MPPCGEHLPTVLQTLVVPFCMTLLLIHISLTVPISHFPYQFCVFTVDCLRKCCKGVLTSLPSSFFGLATMPQNLSIPWISDGIYAFLMCNNYCLLLFSSAIWVFICLLIHLLTENIMLCLYLFEWTLFPFFFLEWTIVNLVVDHAELAWHFSGFAWTRAVVQLERTK